MGICLTMVTESSSLSIRVKWFKLFSMVLGDAGLINHLVLGVYEKTFLGSAGLGPFVSRYHVESQGLGTPWHIIQLNKLVRLVDKAGFN